MPESSKAGWCSEVQDYWLTKPKKYRIFPAMISDIKQQALEAYKKYHALIQQLGSEQKKQLHDMITKLEQEKLAAIQKQIDQS